MINDVIFTSFGNDSLALILWAMEQEYNIESTVVAYSDTVWSSNGWNERINKIMRYIPFKVHYLKSEGFENLVKRKKAFPRNGMQFCTSELKIKPAIKWLDTIDPDKDAVCYVGVRRCESNARRQWPVWVEESDKHGGRSLHSPLVFWDDNKTEEILLRHGFKMLPHRSMECSPCVNANKLDLQALTEDDILKVEKLESTINQLMFRAAKRKGATGIRQVINWAKSEKGKYNVDADQIDFFNNSCDSGYCV